MRRLWLTVAAAAVGCSVPEPSQLEPSPAPEAVEGAPSPAEPDFDPVLADARVSMRGGRVSSEAQARLLASADPDHRRAARLLQVIAGEHPLVPVESSAAVELVPEAMDEIEDVVDVVDIVEPPADAEPPQPPVAVEAPEPAAGPETIDLPPKLAKLPPEGVVHQWFAGMVVVEPQPEESPQPTPVLDRLFDPELLLLRERPPLPSSAGERDGPGLVILTRASLHDGAAPGTATLELAGAGPAEVAVQPLDSHRVRLWVIDAGAVPGFLAARPRGPALEVLDIIRRERVVELELELAPGWSLTAVTRRDNGAAVELARLDTLPP